MRLERTGAQRLDALREANRIRVLRARIKRDLAEGRVTASAILFGADADLRTWRVEDMLRAVPGMGKTKTARALRDARMSPRKTVGGISPRQRAALLAVLAGR